MPEKIQNEAGQAAQEADGQAVQESREGQEATTSQDSAGQDQSEVVDSLEDHQRKAVERANREAASYRRQLRETQEQLEKAVNREDYDRIVSQLADTNKQLVFERYGIDEELRPLVTGSSVEEWEASAKLIASRLGAPAGQSGEGVQETIGTERDPSGSRQAPPDVQAMNPAEAARIALARR